MIAAWAGLVLGLAGSGHCAGMCGPLVLLANPRDSADGQADPRGLTRHVALYHAGRVGIYVLLGLAAGLAGGALAQVGLGRWLAMAAGTALVVSALRGAGLVRVPIGHAGIAGRVTHALARTGVWMRRHRVQGPLLFGALNALLPCGLVYTAAMAAAGFGSPADALLFMIGFGLGTVPMLAAIGISGNRLAARIPPRLRRMAPVAVALAGLLLLARSAGVHGHDRSSPPTPAAAPAHDTHAHH